MFLLTLREGDEHVSCWLGHPDLSGTLLCLGLDSCLEVYQSYPMSAHHWILSSRVSLVG